ncbi:MAG: DUF134 domain-containing protein [Candidatus Marinimicrobia bacterium]|nr:DUF134 domain-containing protein [Candidatus Neomarinimicrobiota bacterium]
MSRHQKDRIIFRPPVFTDFKPVGVRSNILNKISLTIDEYEAIRLYDYFGDDHLEAAKKMEISRSTFTRLIKNAHKKIAEFIIEGKSLKINGGNIHFRENIIKCYSCGYMFNSNFGDKITTCPSCGSKNLIDLAERFGHGEYCQKRGRGRGRRRD